MDRASLVQRRKQLRNKENLASKINSSVENSTVAAKKKFVTGKGPSSIEDTSSQTSLLRDDYDPKSTESGRSASSRAPPFFRPNLKTAFDSEMNAGLVVRQVLQRSQFSDVKEYLHSATKHELFQQALVMATYVQGLKEKHSEVSKAIHEELNQCQAECHSVASNLAERERVCEEQEKEKSELLGRLKIAQEEYQALLAWVRRSSEHEDELKTLQQTTQSQAQLIGEMSEIRRQREDKMNAVEKEREQVFRLAEELQEQTVKLQSQMEMMERDSERHQAELKEERAANKTLTLANQRKAQAVQRVSSELESARNQISTLQGQVQLEAISRQSVTQERDRLQQQYRTDQENWKSAQEHRDSLKMRKADDFRKLDLELRHSTQALSRMRIEWESEKTQREKSDARLLNLSVY
ncbi:hypothetical protein GN958_ATG00010 [Phytophthora infestans]|uniref:Uncharacterized protein n=1 Tax=Phytophthora infestans TaxID=4787 RepID=A0A8S9VHN0_PHYIN|nr:hypothetical protein GN958_ATG00010 [Phytophthora infestans]